VQTYLIGFIDDRTRYLIYYEILQDKTAASAAQALEKAVSLVSHPHTVTTDNGGEFVGSVFEAALTKPGVKHYLTHPYTPQENAKIERFWKTVEESLVYHSFLPSLINMYNNKWPHSGIYDFTKKHMTPLVAWNTMEHFKDQNDLSMVYY
jgi:transposase InsO family protein